MNERIRLLVAMAIFAWSAGVASAQVPPSEYVRMQREAPEVLRINVIQVSRVPRNLNLADVTVVAEVLRVGKTATGLGQGDLITITYENAGRAAGRSGVSEVPILEENSETIAYLKRVEGGHDYEPAAGAMSFSRFVNP